MYSSLLTLIAFVPALTLASTCTRVYTVKTGDYCDLISAANNASTYQLAVVNAGKINDACTDLSVGQTLCLGTSDGDCKATYVVQGGDFCDGITEKFGINTTMLYHNNPQIDATCSNIYEGEVLCVANQGLVPPASAAVPPATVHPSTPAPAPAPVANPAAAPPPPSSPSSNDDGDDEDDDDMPFCDEV